MAISIDHTVARQHNNFDALRVLAAVAVIIGHGATLTGHPAELQSGFGVPFGRIGAAIFFVISGYLIVGSWQRSPSLRGYFTGRVLRIFPALIAVVLVCAFVVGPWVTSLPVSEYFSNTATYSYLRNIALLHNYVLPGVFANNPYPVAVNGSLWSLPAEFACYLIVPAIGLLRGRLQLVGWALFGLVSIALTYYHLTFFGARVKSAALMWVFFAGGALVRLGVKREQLRLDVAATVLIAWMLVVSLYPSLADIAAWFALPYCLLAFGVASSPFVHRTARFGDPSYGLYLWAFPVQQTLVHLFGVLPRAIDLPIVVIVTALLAYTSWHLIEKPSMALAQRLRTKHPARTRQIEAEILMPPVTV